MISHISRVRLAAFAALCLTAAPLAAQTQSAAAPRSGSTIYDFNSLSDGDVVSSQTSAFLVSGGLCAATDYTSYFLDPVQATNFSDHNSAGSYRCGGNYAGAISFVFSHAIDSFGFYAYTDGGAITFNTANGSSTQLRPWGKQYYGITDATPFTSVSFSVAGDGLVVLDDMSYTPSLQVSTTPEPASLVLVGTGLLGMLGVLRRRRGNLAA